MTTTWTCGKVGTETRLIPDWVSDMLDNFKFSAHFFRPCLFRDKVGIDVALKLLRGSTKIWIPAQGTFMDYLGTRCEKWEAVTEAFFVMTQRGLPALLLGKSTGVERPGSKHFETRKYEKEPAGPVNHEEIALVDYYVFSKIPSRRVVSVGGYTGHSWHLREFNRFFCLDDLEDGYLEECWLCVQIFRTPANGEDWEADEGVFQELLEDSLKSWIVPKPWRRASSRSGQEKLKFERVYHDCHVLWHYEELIGEMEEVV